MTQQTGRHGEQRSFPLEIKRVIDGDGFDALVFGTPNTEEPVQEIRLFGIDAPEMAQRYGEEAAEYLSSLVGDARLYMEVVNYDPFGRQVAIVYRNSFEKEETLNYLMVKSGWAYWYQNFDPENRLGLREAEGEAFFGHLGIWQDGGNEERPWDYKARRNREAGIQRDAVGPRPDVPQRKREYRSGGVSPDAQDVIAVQEPVYVPSDAARQQQVSQEQEYINWKTFMESGSSHSRQPSSVPARFWELDDRAFEKRVLGFFREDEGLREEFPEVWPWNKWPGRKGVDMRGVDIVAEDRLGYVVAVKCVFVRSPTIRLSGLDLGLFRRALGSRHFQRGMVCSPAAGLKDSCKLALARMGKRYEYVAF